jgi:hypothetical protein
MRGISAAEGPVQTLPIYVSPSGAVLYCFYRKKRSAVPPEKIPDKL